MAPIFITGTGTGIGKTLVAAILAQALQANYWKPVQAGFDEGTDTDWLKKVVSHASFKAFPEIYRLRMPASPHIAARHEGISISIEKICGGSPQSEAPLLIEGAGGLMVPLNENEFVIDLIKKLGAAVIVVSRNYLGSINHSLLTAAALKAKEINVLGWVFNDQYLDYANEIANWTGLPELASIPHTENPDAQFVREQAERIRKSISKLI
jgi:dethiobiotin synthetase